VRVSYPAQTSYVNDPTGRGGALLVGGDAAGYAGRCASWATRRNLADGTQWVFRAQQAGAERAVNCDNNFPAEVVRFAAALDKVLAENGLEGAAWQPVPGREAGGPASAGRRATRSFQAGSHAPPVAAQAAGSRGFLEVGWPAASGEADVTEGEWLAAGQPQNMLWALWDRGRCRLSERKFRLFACACVRRVWGRLGDGRSREVVELVEQFADSPEVTPAELGQVYAAAKQAAIEFWGRQDSSDLSKMRPGRAAAACSAFADYYAAHAASYIARKESAHDNARGAACEAAWAAGHTVLVSFYATGQVYGSGEAVVGVLGEGVAAERLAQADLLRCVFGNPLRAKLAIDPSWLTWNDCIVKCLAEGIYDERAFERMPVLGDALEEAGCVDQEVLAHLRSPGPHARGCWVVDLLTCRG
jgi:hypothetical protein